MQKGKRKTLSRDWSRLYLGTGLFFLIGFLFFGFSSSSSLLRNNRSMRHPSAKNNG